MARIARKHCSGCKRHCRAVRSREYLPIWRCMSRCVPQQRSRMAASILLFFRRTWLHIHCLAALCMKRREQQMATLKLVDVSIRDGNQSLWSMTGINTAQMVQAAPLMERVGFKAIDFTSSTHMAVGVRYNKDDPWQRIRVMHRMLPNILLQFISTGFRFISWETADHDFMRLAYRTLMKAGIGRFVLLDPMHDMEAIIEVAKLVKEEGDAQNMG